MMPSPSAAARIRRAALVAVAGVSLASAGIVSAPSAQAKHRVIGAAVIGLAIGAAIAGHHHSKRYRHRERVVVVREPRYGHTLARNPYFVHRQRDAYYYPDDGYYAEPRRVWRPGLSIGIGIR